MGGGVFENPLAGNINGRSMGMVQKNMVHWAGLGAQSLGKGIDYARATAAGLAQENLEKRPGYGQRERGVAAPSGWRSFVQDGWQTSNMKIVRGEGLHRPVQITFGKGGDL